MQVEMKSTMKATPIAIKIMWNSVIASNLGGEKQGVAIFAC